MNYYKTILSMYSIGCLLSLNGYADANPQMRIEPNSMAKKAAVSGNISSTRPYAPALDLARESTPKAPFLEQNQFGQIAAPSPVRGLSLNPQNLVQNQFGQVGTIGSDGVFRQVSPSSPTSGWNFNPQNLVQNQFGQVGTIGSDGVFRVVEASSPTSGWNFNSSNPAYVYDRRGQVMDFMGSDGVFRQVATNGWNFNSQNQVRDQFGRTFSMGSDGVLRQTAPQIPANGWNFNLQNQVPNQFGQIAGPNPINGLSPNQSNFNAPGSNSNIGYRYHALGEAGFNANYYGPNEGAMLPGALPIYNNGWYDNSWLNNAPGFPYPPGNALP